jgi:hypothetical protein
MEPLSKDVFEEWRKHDEQFKEEVREHLRAQLVMNIDHTSRIVSLETFRQNDVIKLGIFSTFTSAVFGFVASMWRH